MIDNYQCSETNFYFKVFPLFGMKFIILKFCSFFSDWSSVLSAKIILDLIIQSFNPSKIESVTSKFYITRFSNLKVALFLSSRWTTLSEVLSFLQIKSCFAHANCLVINSDYIFRIILGLSSSSTNQWAKGSSLICWFRLI